MFWPLQSQTYLARVSAAWSAFWFTPVTPDIYAILRVGIGAIGVIDLILASDLQSFWLPGGILPPRSVSASTSVLEIQRSAAGPAAGYGLYFVSLASFALLTVGLGTRLANLTAFACTWVRFSWNSLPLSAAHNLLHDLLFCLLWSRSGDAHSVDSVFRRRKGIAAPTQPIWPLRLMRFQICLMYLSAGLWKLSGPSWLDGSALHWVLNGNILTKLNGLPPSFEGPAILLTYFTVAWELTFPVLILFPATRWLVIAAGVCTHVGMALTMKLGVFSPLVLVGYIAYADPGSLHKLRWPAFRRMTAS
jgi:hypothetical protein